MPRAARSNPLAMAVLVCLYERPMHPYEVAQTLRQRAKQESVRLNYGSLYAVVESLEKRGLIKATGTVQQGRRPQRTVYEITDDGAREMVDWLTDLIATPVKEYPRFMAGLSFVAALHPDDALRALRERADALGFKLAGLRGAMQAAHRAGLPRLFELEGAYEEGQLAAELRFVNGLVAAIEDGSLDGLDLWRGFHDTGTVPFEDSDFRVLPDPDSDPDASAGADAGADPTRRE
ncbi:MAG TPA: PadR family transcriptional regulator [Acidimicrobiales bacterium]|nr:PadR family transcriptional regulator [Acidimicrobiales bacterium]